jgi:hypothetical protein
MCVRTRSRRSNGRLVGGSERAAIRLGDLASESIGHGTLKHPSEGRGGVREHG